MTISAIIIFLSILFTLVVVHELGHFLIAKYFKMRVDEFAFGFPPTIYKKQIGETTYSLNSIPLGGYVKIFGENGLSEEEIKNLNEQDRQRLFGNKPAWQRIFVLCGGVVFNIICAIILFSFAFMMGSNIYLESKDVASTPFQERQLVIVNINEKSPLVGSGISLGDTVFRVEANGDILVGENLSSETFSLFIQEHNNSAIAISYKDNKGYAKQVFAIPQAGIVEGKKIIGAQFADVAFKKYSFFGSIAQAVTTTFDQLAFIFTSLWDLLNDIIFRSAKVEDSLAGPIGLAVMTSKVSERGLDQIFIFAAMLSLSLAVFNILPIPALDGGRVVFVIAEIIRGRKVNASTEQLFHGLGFLALLVLMVFVTYFDIVKAIS